MQNATEPVLAPSTIPVRIQAADLRTGVAALTDQCVSLQLLCYYGRVDGMSRDDLRLVAGLLDACKSALTGTRSWVDTLVKHGGSPQSAELVDETADDDEPRDADLHLYPGLL